MDVARPRLPDVRMFASDYVIGEVQEQSPYTHSLLSEPWKNAEPRLSQNTIKKDVVVTENTSRTSLSRSCKDPFKFLVDIDFAHGRMPSLSPS